MLMDKQEGPSMRAKSQGKTKERWGHRAARLGDNIYVMGGSDSSGNLIKEVNRIHCQNQRIDTLATENVLELQGFALFSLRESLFVWGGNSYRQCSQQLLHFDGTKFTLQAQLSEPPPPRTFHSYASFGSRYLIVYGGHNFNNFFRDWHILDAETFYWKTLTPSIDIGYACESTMCWHNGRGILLTGQRFDCTSKQLVLNSIFQFYITDFMKGTLCVSPIPYKKANTFTKHTFTNISYFDSESVIIFGHSFQHLPHDNCLLINLQTHQSQPLSLSLPTFPYQTVFFKNTLFIFSDHFLTLPLPVPDSLSYKRHVCAMCRLYFDQSWTCSSNETYHHSLSKQDYEPLMRSKIDHQVLHKLSQSIRTQFEAVLAMIDCLRTISDSDVTVDLSKISLSLHTHLAIKLSTNFPTALTPTLLNQLLMKEQLPQSPLQKQHYHSLFFSIFRLQIACLKLSQSFIFTLKLSPQLTAIVYISISQLNSPYSSSQGSMVYHYIYNTTTKSTQQPLNRSIINQNLKWLFKQPELYEESEHSLSVFVVGREQTECEILGDESSVEGETDATGSGQGIREQGKRCFPLIRYSFLLQKEFLFVDHKSVGFINVQALLLSDYKNRLLVKLSIAESEGEGKCIDHCSLFYYPQYYFFKKVLFYHKGRLLRHIQLPQKMICGVIHLSPHLSLDITGTNISSRLAKHSLSSLINSLHSLKRPSPS